VEPTNGRALQDSTTMSALTADQIASLRAAGKTVREIAAELGVSTTTVYRRADPGYLARQNASQRRWKRRNHERGRAGRESYLGRVAPRCSRCGGPLESPSGRPDPVVCGGCLEEATAERRRRVKEISLRGLSPAAIVARLALPSWIVASDLHRLRERGELEPGRPNGFGGPELDRELIALYQDGWQLPEIAIRLGRHKRTITRRLARLPLQGLVERRGASSEPQPPKAPTGFAARTDLARELGFESAAGICGHERLALTGHDGQLAVFYGPELAASAPAARGARALDGRSNQRPPADREPRRAAGVGVPCSTVPSGRDPT
jgi:transposase